MIYYILYIIFYMLYVYHDDDDYDNDINPLGRWEGRRLGILLPFSIAAGNTLLKIHFWRKNTYENPLMKNALLEKCIAIEIKLQQLHLVFAFVIFLPLRYNIPTSLNIYVPTIPDDWEIFKASREGGYYQVHPKWYWMRSLISSEIPLMESWKEYSATCALSYVIRSYIIIAPSYTEFFREVVIW